MLIRALLWILLIYFLYKFIFDFLMPVARVTRKMNEQVKQFRDQTASQESRPPERERTAPKSGEYIDFEEIKE